MSYHIPSIPILLGAASTLYLLPTTANIAHRLIHASLLGPLFLGIVFGPHVATVLPEDFFNVLQAIGYIGLILLIFEGGLLTSPRDLLDNAVPSILAGGTGIFLPITLSILLLHVGFGYTVMQSFAAGAALCSTSLGTTFSLLPVQVRQTKVGVVLTSAAVLDDIVALIISSIIERMASSSSKVTWDVILRPILVSIGFGLAVYIAARLAKDALRRRPKESPVNEQIILFVAVSLLLGMVAAAKYAGTSELYSVYICGMGLKYVLEEDILVAFERHIEPLNSTFLSPLFFATIGAAIPVRSLGSVAGSTRVVWRGIIYSVVMILGKALVGLWAFTWKNPKVCGAEVGEVKPHDDVETAASDSAVPSSQAHGTVPTNQVRAQSALLLGLALVPRGEIALIVVQYAEPILSPDDSPSEPLAVVIWAILLTTTIGAVAVGLFFRINKLSSLC